MNTLENLQNYLPSVKDIPYFLDPEKIRYVQNVEIKVFNIWQVCERPPMMKAKTHLLHKAIVQLEVKFEGKIPALKAFVVDLTSLSTTDDFSDIDIEAFEKALTKAFFEYYPKVYIRQNEMESYINSNYTKGNLNVDLDTLDQSSMVHIYSSNLQDLNYGILWGQLKYKAISITAKTSDHNNNTKVSKEGKAVIYSDK